MLGIRFEANPDVFGWAIRIYNRQGSETGEDVCLLDGCPFGQYVDVEGHVGIELTVKDCEIQDRSRMRRKRVGRVVVEKGGSVEDQIRTKIDIKPPSLCRLTKLAFVGVKGVGCGSTWEVPDDRVELPMVGSSLIAIIVGVDNGVERQGVMMVPTGRRGECRQGGCQWKDFNWEGGIQQGVRWKVRKVSTDGDRLGGRAVALQ